MHSLNLKAINMAVYRAALPGKVYCKRQTGPNHEQPSVAKQNSIISYISAPPYNDFALSLHINPIIHPIIPSPHPSRHINQRTTSIHPFIDNHVISVPNTYNAKKEKFALQTSNPTLRKPPTRFHFPTTPQIFKPTLSIPNSSFKASSQFHPHQSPNKQTHPLLYSTPPHPKAFFHIPSCTPLPNK